VPLSLRTGSCCLQGNYRQDNEDRVAVVEWPDAVVCVVADGMGGPPLGRQASEQVIASLLANLDKPSRDQSAGNDGAVRTALYRAQDDVRLLQTQTGRRAGSSVVLLLWIRGAECVLVGHVGDTRAYHLSAQGTKALTVVHDVRQALIAAGTITQEQADQGIWRNVLYKFLGADVPDLAPDLVRVSISAGDRFMLCSNGLWGVVRDEQLAAILTQMLDAQVCADDLAQLALTQGSRDNVSCVVVNVVETVVSSAP
jgi:PPM family protein phosphatase